MKMTDTQIVDWLEKNFGEPIREMLEESLSYCMDEKDPGALRDVIEVAAPLKAQQDAELEESFASYLEQAR
jgi:hypothetical protein